MVMDHAFDVFQAVYQFPTCDVHAHFAPCAAGGVNGHFDVVAFVFGRIADIQQEVGEFDHAVGHFLRLRFIPAAFEYVRPVVFHHAAAGTGRHDYRPVFGEQVQLGFGDFKGFLRMPRCEGGLAAAALRHREMHADALLLNQRNRIHTCFGHENVQQARAEKIHIGRFASDSGFGICVHGLAFGLCFGKLVGPILLE